MSDLDEQHEDLRDGKRRVDSGGRIDIRDPRVSAALNWVWTVLGSLALLIGVGMYNKLSTMNDTLLVAVSQLQTQGAQIADLRAEMSKLRDEQAALRSQVFMLEGKTLRSIQEASRGH